ncbi:PREDICTED: uncharacterized protein LOC109330628 [Lupinus angustifolius]|uniref:uncharacterized protein LOC109330628 n=1 Tax=Lupinus angustifolius TaxID=3871 RepID=UPI00092E9BA9|nr:PREDICTED: uncharacterized protein LOC109330628 [Lupinus angustifolius]
MVTANCVRKTLQAASSSTRTLFSRQSSPSASYASKFNSLPSSPKVSTQKRSLSFSWLPVQLASVQVSLTPLHSVTASALFTSLLSLHNSNWGCLSEGFATPL